MRCYFYSFLVFFFWLQTATAQTQINIDSLQKQSKDLIYVDSDKSTKISDYVLQNSDDNLLKIRELLTKSENYFLQKDFLSAIAQLKILSGIQIENNFWELKKDFLLIEMLDSLDLNSNAEKLIKSIQNSLSNLQDLNQKKEIEIQLQLLLNENSIQDFQEIEKDLEKLQLENKKVLQNKLRLRIASEFLKLSNFNSANYYFSKSDENPNSYFYFKFELGNASILSKQQKFEESNQILLNLLKSKSNNKNLFSAEIYEHLSQNYLNLNNSQQSAFYKNLFVKNFDKELENKQKARMKIVDLMEVQNKNVQSETLSFYWKIIYISASILLVVLAFFSFKFFQNKLKTKRLFLENKNKEWLESTKKEMEAKWMEEKNTPFIIPEKTEIVILEKLKKFENSNQYLNAELSLNSLAKEFNTNTSYLSEIINKHLGKNFKTYINELRINYIADKMRNHPEYLTYKISYLADEAGFTSRTSFTTIFKSVTGVSPSVFIESIQQNNKQ